MVLYFRVFEVLYVWFFDTGCFQFCMVLSLFGSTDRSIS